MVIIVVLIIRYAGVNKNKSSWNLDVKYSDKYSEKYSDEDFEKLADYLLTPIPYEEGMVPMDKLLNYLESHDDESKKNSNSKWCDLGKENYQKELENCESGD